MDFQEKMRLERGKAVFLSPEYCLHELRHATKKALLQGKVESAFVVTYENHYYPHVLDGMLSTETKFRELVIELGNSIIGKRNGALCCAALWDTGINEGILIHREGNRLVCAYIPIVILETVRNEHLLAMRLASLADDMQRMSIVPQVQLKSGNYDVGALLRLFSEQMDG